MYEVEQTAYGLQLTLDGYIEEDEMESYCDTVVRDSLPPWLVKTRFSKPLTPKYVSRSRNQSRTTV
jgi:hypothetical protein